MDSATPKNQDVWAIIPARGGSKGIPRKNLTSVAGVPLLVRTIRACRSSDLITSIIVSTDDAEISEMAATEGAIVIERPRELATDSASSESAVIHAINLLTGSGLPAPAFSLLVQCTSPFLSSKDLTALVELLIDGSFDSCFTAARSHRFLWQVDNLNRAHAINHDPNLRLPRQELQPEFIETGSAYGFSTQGFLEAGSRFFGNIGMCEIPNERAIEIDEPFDLSIANAIALTLRNSGSRIQPSPLPPGFRAIAFDFDGVMTDDLVKVDQNGLESVTASRSDGYGISRLRNETTLKMLVISSETNAVVAQRCAKIGIECMTGIMAKDVALRTWLGEIGINPRDCIYVGNDVNDLSAFATAGYSVAPADAHPIVLESADLILSKQGGRGAVRELAEILIDHLNAAQHRSTSPRLP